MKKKYSYIGIAFIILVFGIIFIPKIIERISDGTVVTADRLNIKGSETSKKSTGEDLAYIKLDGKKKKAPYFKFVDQHGDTITNKDYLGKVYVVEFFFTTCPTICPIMNDNLVEVQNELKGEENFGVASFTIDPTHDTPEVLAEYAENKGITNPNWHLMTGDRDAIYNLANVGFQTYAGVDPKAKGGFVHSGMFALVDKDGYLRSRKDNFGNPIIYYRGFVERNKSIAEDEEEPQIDILIQDIKKLL
ncbi:SCO family protein [Zunongwangia sp.]|uniref:SCO family protein n=1 Tax=Zunongwangia sp. TaxID=1965325 RepID=UPI003AA9BE10